MSTTEQIHDALTQGEVSTETVKLAAQHDIHELMFKLKDLYERIYGAIAADIHDWHWIATKVKQTPPQPDALTTDTAIIQQDATDAAASQADVKPADAPPGAAPAAASDASSAAAPAESAPVEVDPPTPPA